MKTNVVMIRSMGNFKVTQRIKDSMFNATTLLKQWNESNNLFGRKGKRIDDFLRLENTQSFLKTLEEELNTEDSRYLKTHESTRGKNGGTWMHPYLFIDFAMWLNPKFKIKVIKFVYDELIKNRHAAGDNYKMLSESGSKLKGYNFQEVAKALNWIVFGKHNKNLRQIATPNQLRELSELQTKLSFAIDMGYIKSYKQLLSELRKVWSEKQIYKTAIA